RGHSGGRARARLCARRRRRGARVRGERMTVRASAPGKLFLTGEWAVLRGAPALVAAVDRRVSVTIEPGTDGVVVESLAEGRADRLNLGSADAPLPRGDARALQAAVPPPPHAAP